MDPNAALAEVIEAAADGRHEDVLIHAEDLATWLRKGGFAPADPRPPAGWRDVLDHLADELPTLSNRDLGARRIVQWQARLRGLVDGR